MDNISISLCVISGGGRPEQLDNCLKSIHKYVNEIIITFTKHCGKSLEVAKKYKAIVTYFPWNGSFSDARNFNWSHATKEVILWLDDDDIVINGGNLNQAVNDAFSHELTGCLFVMYNYERDKDGLLVTRHWRDRIVKPKFFKWVSDVHESLTPINDYEQFVSIKTDKLLVEHTESQINWKLKHERNLKILYLKLEKEKDDPDARTLMYLGKTLFGLHEYEKAEKYFREYLEISGWDEEKYQAIIYLGNIYFDKKQYNKSLNQLYEAIKISPGIKVAYFAMAEVYHAMGAWDKCIYWTEEAFKKKDTFQLVAENPRKYDYNPLLLLSEALMNKGRCFEAMDCYLKLIEFSPNNKFFKKLFNVCKQLDEIDKASIAFMKASEFCLQNEQLALAEKVIEAVPLEVKDCNNIRNQRSRIRKIMERIRGYEKGKRRLAKNVRAWYIPQLDIEWKYQMLLGVLKQVNPTTILDVGCYNGWMANGLAKEGYNITACDISEETIGLAKQSSKQIEHPPKFEICNIKDVGSTYYKKFDVVTCFDVLEHVLHPQHLIDNLENACKDGGWVFIHIPNGAWHRGNMDFQNEELWEHVYSYEYPEIVRLLVGRQHFQVFKREVDTVRSPGQSSLFIAYQNIKNMGRLIEFFCPTTLETWSPGSVKTGIGGSEEAVINMAQELFKLGHKVIVYNNCGEHEGIYNNIPYVDINFFDQFGEHDIIIAWRDPQIFKLPITANKKYVWMHDVPNMDIFSKEIIDSLDGILVLSQFHATLFDKIPQDKLFITSNGVDVSLFNKIEGVKRNPYKVVYGSSPDRGLDKLLEIWGDVKKAVPQAELHIFYGWGVYDVLRTSPKQIAWKKKIMDMVKQEGIIWRGRVGHEELANEYMSSGVWAFPTYFPEISCITAMKCQIAGAIPVCTDYAALEETVSYGVKINGSINVPGNLEKFKDRLIAELLNPDEKYREKMMKESSKKYNWSLVAQDWNKNLFKEEKKND